MSFDLHKLHHGGIEILLGAYTLVAIGAGGAIYQDKQAIENRGEIDSYKQKLGIENYIDCSPDNEFKAGLTDKNPLKLSEIERKLGRKDEKIEAFCGRNDDILRKGSAFLYLALIGGLCIPLAPCMAMDQDETRKYR